MILFVPARSVAQIAPDQRFGMTEAFWSPEEARDLGVGWERILFYWREIQPQGPEDWNTLHVLEEWLVEAKTQGREVVGLIKNTAPWASVDGTEAGLPKGLNLASDDPGNLWANYVGRLADYYGPLGVHHWIIWNEPEIQSGVYGFEFAGTAADYYQMLKIAYMVIKQRDPQAIIHLAGLTWWHDPTFLDRLLAIASADPEAKALGYFFDVISLHIYFRTETVRSIIEEVVAIQGRYGLEKPIWINETNAPPNRDPDWPVDRPRFNIDLDQQAWFIVQAMALGFASGAERVSVYKLLDIHLPPGGESFGLLRPDQSRRPAYAAYKMATRCFGAFESATVEVDPLYYRVTFARPGALTHVAWSRTPVESEVKIAATAKAGQALRLVEESSELLASEGAYALSLPGQRCDQECLVGGEPLLLVETLGDETLTESCLDFRAESAPADLDEPKVAPTAGATPLEDSALSDTLATPFSVGQQQSARPTVGATASAIVQRASEASETNPTRLETLARPVYDHSAVEQGISGDTGAGPIPNGEVGASGGTIGLWFLGFGIGLALLMSLLHLRSRNSRRP